MDKVNYNTLFKKEIELLNERVPSLLLHVCCGPCLSVALSKLIGKFNITLYYYNPNITPVSEYDLRLYEVKKLADIYGFKVIAEEYNFSHYKDVVGKYLGSVEHGIKCDYCCDDRINATAKKAKELGLEYFSTTLSASPLKNVSFLNIKMKEASTKYDVKYLPSDYKKENGTLSGRVICEKYNVYRQCYCGCTPNRGITIGLTGGIGSGKSTSLNILKQHGIKVESADYLVHKLESKGTAVYEKLKISFPNAFINGELNRKELSAIVFANVSKKESLQNIIYPELNYLILRLIAENKDIIVVEVPLLFENGLEKYFDYTISITALNDIKKSRIMNRDDRNGKEIDSIISSQLSDDKRKADFIISNNEDLKTLEKNLISVLDTIRK